MSSSSPQRSANTARAIRRPGHRAGSRRCGGRSCATLSPRSASTSCRLLGYEDGHLSLVDACHGRDVIAEHIVEIEPDLIVTFGPDGMTGHPDHRAISQWTTDAWITTGSSADLWYATLTPDFHRTWGTLNDEIGLWADQPDPPCTEPGDLAMTMSLLDDVLDRKINALRAHASQTTPLIEHAGPARFREWWRTESFRAAEVVAVAAAD